MFSVLFSIYCRSCILFNTFLCSEKWKFLGLISCELVIAGAGSRISWLLRGPGFAELLSKTWDDSVEDESESVLDL